MISEQVVVAAPASAVFEAVADMRRMARWSPECFAVWVTRRSAQGRPERFIGWNRCGPFVWFTSCRVTESETDRRFAFDVFTFGLPVSGWAYEFAPVDGGTRVTETWTDRRGRGALLLGRIFTGRVANARPEANRAGMRETLARLKRELESNP